MTSTHQDSFTANPQPVMPAATGTDRHMAEPAAALRPHEGFAFEKVIDQIDNLPWERLSEDEILRVAMAYYYFSVQFRENLEVACRLHPDDGKLKELYRGECNTDNLSPWKNVAEKGEVMNHDEFMRRLLALQPIADAEALERAGSLYLSRARAMDDVVKAMSIASYEDGGLERVFSAMLRAPSWNGAGQLAFRHFLEKHIEFDSDDEAGHGALSRHIPVDDSILTLWSAFEEILRCAVPAFARDGRQSARQAELAP